MIVKVSYCILTDGIPAPLYTVDESCHFCKVLTDIPGSMPDPGNGAPENSGGAPTTREDSSGGGRNEGSDESGEGCEERSWMLVLSQKGSFIQQVLCLYVRVTVQCACYALNSVLQICCIGEEQFN
jgi:hypothetical protein